MVVTITNGSVLPPGDEHQLQLNLFNHGPFAMILSVDDWWPSYVDGIYSNEDCASEATGRHVFFGGRIRKQIRDRLLNPQKLNVQRLGCDLLHAIGS